MVEDLLQKEVDRNNNMINIIIEEIEIEMIEAIKEILEKEAMIEAIEENIDREAMIEAIEENIDLVTDKKEENEDLSVKTATTAKNLVFLPYINLY